MATFTTSTSTTTTYAPAPTPSIDRIKKSLLSQVKYQREPGELRFSASMFSNTDLQNYLTILYGAQDSSEIGQAEIGSIFHLGIEQAIKQAKGNSAGLEEAIEYEREDGWKITARMDYKDSRTNITKIRDWKLTKLYAGKMVKKDLNHAYRLQVNVAKHILQKNGSTRAIQMYLHMFYKDQDLLIGDTGYEVIQISDIPDIDKQIDDKVTILDNYIKTATMPPECSQEDKWFRKNKKSGNLVASRCELYCSVKDYCPYFKKPSARTSVANW